MDVTSRGLIAELDELKLFHPNEIYNTKLRDRYLYKLGIVLLKYVRDCMYGAFYK